MNRLLFLSLIFLIGCVEINDNDIENQNQGSTEATTLLQIVNGNTNHSDDVYTIYWEDISPFKRFMINHNVPKHPDASGGITFNGIDSYIAVNDGFMSGLINFEISFWFISTKFPQISPEGETASLIASNWASPNDGDWLIMFDGSNKLRLLIQGQTIDESTISGLNINEKYYLRLKKSINQLTLYINDQPEILVNVEEKWTENGSPLTFGANPYDRYGMGYFQGSIGNIKITSQ